MRSIRLVLTVPSRTVDDVYATIADFARYPQFSEAVRSVSVAAGVAGSVVSSWEVNFRNGILRWVEEDTFDPARHHIEFRQLEGDIAAFDGNWSCVTSGPDVTVTFAARVDLGIPSLADALEPIAVRTLVANTVAIVTGLLGDGVHVHGVDDDATASSTTSTGA
jgi:ribosome-associated toxin RatA of RatAB toxin-antitoxin module